MSKLGSELTLGEVLAISKFMSEWTDLLKILNRRLYSHLKHLNNEGRLLRSFTRLKVNERVD